MHACCHDSVLSLGLIVGARNTNTYVNVKPGTHWRQSRQSPKSATKSTVDFITDLSPVCRKLTVAGSFDLLSTVLRSTLSPKLNMFNSIDFVESE